jgi:peptide/nickel transport system ATP-binding protein
VTDAPEPLLSVRNLTVELRGRDAEQPRRVVDGLSLELRRGQTLGLAGESGSGKTMAALALLGLVPDPPGRVTAGQVLFEGRDLLALPPQQLRQVRGQRIAMVFQEPKSALNPVLTVGTQVAEALLAHRRVGRAEARRRTVEALRRVGLPAPQERLAAYPHQLSGGMQQRVLLAMALICEPALLIADEPTTALDVTLEAQVIQLLRQVQRETGMALLFISHDLGLLGSICQRLAVMRAGRLLEQGTRDELFSSPRHPYTAQLLQAARELAAPAPSSATPGDTP